MKKIFLLLALVMMLYTTNKASAQSYNVPQAGANITDPGLDKFVGLWVWGNGTDTLKVVLKKQNFQSPIDTYSKDYIVGFHQYKSGGQIIENNLQYQNKSYLDDKSSFLGSSDKANLNILFGTLSDFTKNKEVNAKFSINSTGKQLTMIIKEIPGIHINEPNVGRFTLPNNIVLKKYVPIENIE